MMQPKIFDIDVARLRRGLGLSQHQFSKLLNISIRTLQKWEQGVNTPTGPAITLLKIVQRHPETLLRLDNFIEKKLRHMIDKVA